MSVFNRSRTYVIRAIFLAVFIVILAQLVNLQIFGRKYHEQAVNNAVFAKMVYPERGIIFDRKGRPVLNNIIMFDLAVTPAEVRNMDTVAFCKLMDIDTAEFRNKILEAIVKNTRVRPSIFMSLLTPDMQARFEENSWRFSGFHLVARPVRNYPHHVGAHILGYISEADQRDIERSGGFYRMGDYRGKNGLEYTYEKVLMGQRGVEYMIRDHKNRLVGRLENGRFDTMAVAGRGLKTHIDVELQALAEKLIRNKVGAAVAIDPKTGGILAMASGPTFDPNDLTGPEFKKNYQKMNLDVASPLLNRGIQGRYPPGSTFKPLGGLVALNEGVITPAFGYPCGGRYYACGSGKPGCEHAGGGHAANLRLAIAHSCNAYFADVYRKVVDNPKYGDAQKGYEVWENYMNLFGMGVRLGVDLPGEGKGNIPSVADYDKEYRGYWNSCTNLTLGIGQDKMLATPLQLANAMCIIANRGYYYTPHFVDSLEQETLADSVLMNRYRTRHNALTHISDTAFSATINGMQDVVTQGTARNVKIPGINVCAKTGTAQNSRIIGGKKWDLPHNAMFVCFAPKENPRICVAVVVESGGYGGSSAGPIARLLMEKYLFDTLDAKSLADVERTSKVNLLPPYLPRLQYLTDSARAYQWLKDYQDSSLIYKFLAPAKVRAGSPVKRQIAERGTKGNQRKQKKVQGAAITDAALTRQKKIANQEKTAAVA